MVIYQKTSQNLKISQPIPVTENESEPQIFKMPLKSIDTVEKIEPQIPIIKKEITSVAESPVVIKSLYDVALLSYSQGNYAEVIDILQKTGQSLDEQILLIRASSNIGRIAEALKSCEKAINAHKTDARLHYLYATILQECNQLNEAVTSLKHATFLDSDFVLSYYSLGNIYKRLGNDTKAKKSYENVLSILNKYRPDEILPESEGLTAGRFKEIINATLKTGTEV